MFFFFIYFNMKIVNNIKNFLYDKNYFITIYDNYIHLFNYEKIIKFSKDELIFIFSEFKLTLKGENLLIRQMLKNEVLIIGKIKSFNIIYGKENMD